ncbi:MAG: DUF2177 family protein [Betaproteobacteria bacterium]
MSKILLPYFTIVLVMVLLDVAWLGGVARPLYQRGIGHLMADKPNFVAAVLFYLLYAVGLMVFVVLPRASGDWQSAAAYGALFGFMGYMTYDLTNLATLRDWPLGLSLVDTAWGCVATGAAATASKLVADRWA